MENLFLARTQESGTRDRAPFFEQLLGAGLQSMREASFGRDENLEIVRIRATDETLHGQHAGHSFHRAIQIGAGFGAKLGGAGGPFIEHKRARSVDVRSPGLRRILLKYTCFLQCRLPVLP